MSLRSKVVVIVAGIIGLYSIVDYAIQRRTVLPSFVQLEREGAERDLRRCVGAIERELQQLGTTAGDYGAWDDTAQFVADGNEQYIEDNMTPSTLKGIGVNLLCICNPQGRIMVAKTLDLGTQEPLPIPDFPAECLPPTHVLLRLREPTDAIQGILMTSLGPLLLASRPVLNDLREGPVRGAVIMGRFLNAGLVARLREQTQVHFDVCAALANPLLVSVTGEPQSESPAIAVSIDDSQAGVLLVSTTLPDLTGRPILPIRATVERQVTARGLAAMRFATGSLAAVGLVVLMVLLAALRWAVLGPVSILTEHVVRVGTTDDLTARLSLSTSGEIAILATEFNRMVERLADARKKLLEQSYASGIAEMASGTLHNVRNALTPVMVELDMLRQELAQAPVDQMDVARRQLAEQATSDSRRQDLAKFLELAGDRLVCVARHAHAKLDHVSEQTRQIEQFLSDQEDVSRTTRPLEAVVLAELIRDAAALLPAALRDRISLETGPGVARTGTLKTQRIGLLQVLNNVLLNAAEAIVAAGKERGTVVVDADLENDGGLALVHLRIRDDGEGIAPENLRRIFERGFTTRGHAARGLGLHWCANCIAAMNGKMYAESDGPARGARLHVLIPQTT